MEPESILIRTLTLFAITIVLAVATFALAIWWVVRQGTDEKCFLTNGSQRASSSEPPLRTLV